MSLSFASNLTKMIDAGLGGEVIAPDTSVAIGYRMQYNMVSGPVASWNDPEGGFPLKSIVVDIEPIQSGSGDPSPENVRPISGRTGLGVTRTGKNLFDKSVIESRTGYLNSNGEFVSQASWRVSDYIPVSSGSSITTSGGTADTTACFCWYDANKSFISSVKVNNATFTVPTGAKYIKCSVINSKLDTFQLEIGSEASAYESYNGESVVFFFGDTIYGGRLDVENGVLTVDRTFLTIDGTANWTEYAAGKFYVGNVTNGAAKSTTRYISNQYLFSGDGTTSSNQIAVNKRFYGQNAYGRIWVCDSQYTTLEDLKAALSTTPLQIVYPIERPMTVQLTPQTINSLLGQNNAWSDAGDVSVTWKEKLYTEGY